MNDNQKHVEGRQMTTILVDAGMLIISMAWLLILKELGFKKKKGHG